MPRQQTARSSARPVDNPPKRSNQQKNPKQLLSEVLGGDPEFADKFFGESPNMSRPLRAAENADGDVSMDGGQGPNGTHDGEESNKSQAGSGPGHHRVPKHVGNSAITIENTPHDIDHLIIRQLEEDLDSYRYDVDFCKTQLDPENMATITPAEARTFQLRLLDLGHQMRSIHHRIQLMQAGINNSLYTGTNTGRAGTTTANAYYGSYPSGTYGSYSATGPSTPYDARQGRPPHPSSVYAAYNEAPQERKGPGRPLGSKNRTPRLPADAPRSGTVGTIGSAKAAALASAGAKRTLPSEILVATLTGDAAPEGDASSSGKPSKKRARLDAGAIKPNADIENEAAPSPPASTVNSEGRNSDDSESTEANDTVGLADEASKNGSATVDHSLVESEDLPSTPAMASQSTSAFTAANRAPSGGPASGPRGSSYTRLGHWMCTLCTSQKYLKHPSPKQPAEPSSWALRDISKIVTHFTRMHTEHTDAERCQELGNALGYNSGPFKYWVQVTKKTQVTDEQIQEAIAELNEGNLPELLRKLSAAAALFPRRD